MGEEMGRFTEHCREAGSAFSLDVKQLLHRETTPYQTIEIFETTHFGNLMVIDGFTMLTDRDNFLYHEMMSHPVMFSHPHPQKVLVVGGGDCGTMREVLKHETVSRVDQVEIDERVTRLAEEYFPDLCSSNNDSRAFLHFTDAIQWVKDAEDGAYDVIIIDSTDPIGPAEGLFSVPFYKDCYRILGERGLLVQQSESPLYHLHILQAMYRDMGAVGFDAINTLFFPQPIYPSGWWSATMAAKNKGMVEIRRQDAAAKTFPTRYYNVDIHAAALAQPEFFKQGIKDLAD